MSEIASLENNARTMDEAEDILYTIIEDPVVSPTIKFNSLLEIVMHLFIKSEIY